jgi:N-acetyl-anhydromuramyl-L-alanine amidase AmpD
MLGALGLEQRFENDALYAYDIDLVSDRNDGTIPFSGAKKHCKLADTGMYNDVGPGLWRGYRYFDAYERAQIAATIGLVKELVTRFPVPKVVPMDIARPNPSLCHERAKSFEGIASHATFRADKSDVHALFPWDLLVKEVGCKYV